MRDSYPEFQRRNSEVIGVAPHGLAESQKLAQELALPFPVLADANRGVFQSYDVPSRVWSLGQRPGLYVIDRRGIIRWAHVGWQQWDIPTNAEVLAALDAIAAEASVSDERSL